MGQRQIIGVRGPAQKGAVGCPLADVHRMCGTGGHGGEGPLTARSLICICCAMLSKALPAFPGRSSGSASRLAQAAVGLLARSDDQ